MHKHYAGIGILGIVVFIILVYGFSITGSPISQRSINLDKARISNMNDISYKIQNYYSNNHKIPDSLSNIPERLDYKDPETQKDYVYEKVTDTSYKLCASFSTDSAEVAKKYGSDYSSSYYYTNNSKKGHKEGFDCIEYTIPDYLQKTTRSPLPFKSY